MIVHIAVVDADEIFMSQQQHSTIRFSIDSWSPPEEKWWNLRESLLLLPKAGGGYPRLDACLGSFLLCTRKRWELRLSVYSCC